MSSKDESGFERWAGLHFDLKRGEIWTADERGTRAPEFQVVIDVLRGISHPPERSDEIRAAAFNICSAAMFAGMGDQPNLQENPGGTAGDLKELQHIHDLCFGLVDSLFQLHRGSRGALEKQDSRSLRKFQKEVGRWSDRAHEAWSELGKTEHRAPRSGAPMKEVKAAIRPVALQVYERLTGRPAARKLPDSGPLAAFFEALFIAFGLPQKGAKRQARQAIEERNAALAKTPL